MGKLFTSCLLQIKEPLGVVDQNEDSKQCLGRARMVCFQSPPKLVCASHGGVGNIILCLDTRGAPSLDRIHINPTKSCSWWIRLSMAIRLDSSSATWNFAFKAGSLEPLNFYSSLFVVIAGRANHGWNCKRSAGTEASLKLWMVFNLAGCTAWLCIGPPDMPGPLGSSGTCTSDGAQQGFTGDIPWKCNRLYEVYPKEDHIVKFLNPANLFWMFLSTRWMGMCDIFWISALNQPWTEVCTFSLELAAGSLESSATLSRSPPRTGWLWSHKLHCLRTDEWKHIQWDN